MQQAQVWILQPSHAMHLLHWPVLQVALQIPQYDNT